MSRPKVCLVIIPVISLKNPSGLLEEPLKELFEVFSEDFSFKILQ